MLGLMGTVSESHHAKSGKCVGAFGLELLAIFGIVSVLIWWIENRFSTPDSLPAIRIGDGSGLMGREILAAAALLSNERVVRIEFFDKKFGPR